MADMDPLPSPRMARFDLQEALAGNWHGGSIIRSHAFNALSAFLPAGEAFMVRAVRQVTQASGQLDHDIDVSQFLLQESMHLRQHDRYNARVAKRYSVFPKILGYMRRHWRLVRAVTTLRGQLGITVVIEHMTASLSRLILEDDRVLSDADPEYSALWRWHALEELEHKTVAFSLYNSTGGRKWTLIYYMIFVTAIFSIEYAVVFLSLLASDRILFRRRAWREIIGMTRSPQARRFWTQYRGFFARGYSPDQIDDHALILQWRSDIELLRRFRGAQAP